MVAMTPGAHQRPRQNQRPDRDPNRMPHLHAALLRK
jgi:hypothetical protein